MIGWSPDLAARWKRALAVRPLDEEAIALPWEEIQAALAEMERLGTGIDELEAEVDDLQAKLDLDAADEEQ